MNMCYHPWVGLDVSPQGEFKPCCKYKNTLATNMHDYESSQELAQLRHDFLNGQKPEGCERCWRDESAGLQSKRNLDFEYVFKKQIPELSGLKIISLPFGNTCNLACRFCSSYSSSRWSKESKKLLNKLSDITIYSHSKFYQDTNFMQAIINKLDDVIRIDIPGGEPFYADNKIHYNFLSGLNSKNISLHYITNTTKFPDQSLLDLLKSFKHVDIQFSIDGDNQQRFEYARWPAAWDQVLKNIRLWQEFHQYNSNIQISVSHTVSMFTIYHLPEFLTWCADNHLPEPYLGLLSKPEIYNISILPKHAKEHITKRFEGIELLQPIIKAMWAQDDSKSLDKFIKDVKIVDVHRKQSFPDTYPELFKLLGEECQTLYQQS